MSYPPCPHTRTSKLPKPRPRVISASKRTDIPAFYMDWVVERFQAGWVDVPNSMFRYASDPLKRLIHVSLKPEHVIAIVWWSKNYEHYERCHWAFASYKQFFQFTINPRRPDLAWLEPDLPPLEEALRQARFLASLPGGPGMVAWRYDPICFWREGSALHTSWDAEFFERVCRELSAMGIHCCFTSVADLYGKYMQRVRRFYPAKEPVEPNDGELWPTADEMAGIARRYGMRLFTCCEPRLAQRPGFSKGACIDGNLLGATTAAATDRKMRGREECGCTKHTDIGDYEKHECGYSCLYCYANPNHGRFVQEVADAP